MTCVNCNDTKFIDVRAPYKDAHAQAMTSYVPIWILCPTCAKEYRCEKCNSINTELRFLALSIEEAEIPKILGCKDCGHRQKIDD